MTIPPDKLPCLISVFWEMNENNIVSTDVTMDEGPYPVSLKSFSHWIINFYSSQIKVKARKASEYANKLTISHV